MLRCSYVLAHMFVPLWQIAGARYRATRGLAHSVLGSIQRHNGFLWNIFVVRRSECGCNQYQSMR